MKIVQLPDVLHTYLLELIERHAAQGIHPQEGLAINRLWEAVQRATHVPDADIQKMAAAATPQGQSNPAASSDATGYVEVERHSDGKTITVECQQCYDEEGSMACIRPAHQKGN